MMSIRRLILGAGLLWATQTFAEVRLLSGDANNDLHDADANVLDLSADGTKLLISTGPPVSGSTPGINRGGLYLRDLTAGTLTFVGVPVGGENNNNPTDDVDASMSDDGRYFAWSTPHRKIFWRDHQAGATRSITPDADGDCGRPIISADGRYVAYVSVARNLITDNSLLPANNRAGVYLYDSVTEATQIISLTSDGTGLATGVGSSAPVNEFDLSADGKYVVFSTDSSNMHPERASQQNQAWYWVYRRNIGSGVVDIVNRNASGDISPAGNYVTPRSDSTGNRVLLVASFMDFGNPTMLPGYTQGFQQDSFVKDMTTEEVFRPTTPMDGMALDGTLLSHVINGDGTVVVFGSTGTKFVPEDDDPGPSNSSFDIFRADIEAGGEVTLSLISKAVFDEENVEFTFGPYLPASGDYIVFNTSDVYSMLGEGMNNSIYRMSVGVGDFTFLGGGDGYQAWANALDPGQAALLDKPYGEATNLERFVYGMAPTEFDSVKLPVNALSSGTSLGLAGDDNLYLNVTVRVLRDLPAGFSINANVAATIDELVSNPTAATQVGNPVPDDDVDVYTFRAPFHAGNTATGFIAIVLSSN